MLNVLQKSSLLNQLKPLSDRGLSGVVTHLIYMIIWLSLTACLQTSQPSKPEAYITEQGKVWAHGDVVLGDAVLGGVDSGVMLENLTPGKDLNNQADREKMEFELYRALSSSLAGGPDEDSDMVFVDLHPTDDTKALSYVYRPRFSGSGNTVEISFILVKAAPTYKIKVEGEPDSPAKEVPIGRAVFRDQNHRASIELRSGLKIARVLNGPGRGHWAIYESEKAYAGKLENIDELCRNATHLSGTVRNDVASLIMSRCQPQPTALDFCDGDPLTGSCLPLAPVSTDDPFTNIGLIDASGLSPIRPLNEKRRQYRFSEQSAGDDQVGVLFIAKKITATPASNAQLCRDLFEAKAWTVGERINPACKITPAPSPEPKDGMLACKIFVGFAFPQNYLEKNCYVKGLFAREADNSETVQILTP